MGTRGHNTNENRHKPTAKHPKRWTRQEHEKAPARKHGGLCTYQTMKGDIMKKITVKVTPEDAKALRKLAAERGQTISETFSEAVRKGLEERGQNGKEKI